MQLRENIKRIRANFGIKFQKVACTNPTKSQKLFLLFQAGLRANLWN